MPKIESARNEKINRALTEEIREFRRWEAEKIGARLDALNKDLLRRGVLKESDFI